MLSKEQVLKDYFGEIDVPFNEKVYVYYPALLNAMSEYAEQIAIEFGEYINNNKLFESDISGNPLWYQSENHKFKPLTSEKLFATFKKENNIQ